MMRLYALTAIVLSLKMSAIGIVQGRARTAAKKFANPEDAKMFGATLVDQEVPTVQRASKAWLNDLENIPMFLILALVYAIAGLSSTAFAVYCVVFMVARILHTFFYIKAMQPWRTIAFTVGAIAMVGLIIQLFVGFVIVGGD
jgi:glutathione S-transferase